MFQPAPRRGLLSPPMAQQTTVHGDDVNDDKAIFKRLRSLGLDGQDPSAIVEGDQPALPQVPGLPKAPPRLSANPWSKENRSRTLLDLGQAFLSSQDFTEGLGKAAGSLGNRMDELEAASAPKVDYGVGPGGQFQVTTGPDGQREVSEIPEFAKANQAEREAKRPVPAPKDIAEMRARALHAIQGLPEDQRAAAYASLMTNPQAFGGIDVEGMPPAYDASYANVMGNMGQSVSQAANADYRERAFSHRQSVDRTRIGQAQQRLDKPPAPRKAPAPSKPPAGYILD